MSNPPSGLNAKGAPQQTGDPPKPPHLESYANYKEPYSKRLKRYCNRNLGRVLIGVELSFAFALVIITGWYTHYAAGQLAEMRKSTKAAQDAANAARQGALEAKNANDFARDALVKVQRAFVVINKVPDMQLVEANGDLGILFNFYLENSGTTPTRKFTAHINWYYGSDPMPDNFAFPDRWKPDAPHRDPLDLIGPKGKSPLNAGPISRAIIERVLHQQLHLYFYGWARYNDIFSNTPRYVTKFCYEMVPGVGVPVQNGLLREGYQLMPCRNNNCYDEECKE
jgi:hypothetical protein